MSLKMMTMFFLAGAGAMNLPQVIELGQVIRPSDHVTIQHKIDKGFDLPRDYRFKTNYLTVNLRQSNLTIIRYDDILPFSAKGCMPVFYYANHPENLVRDDINSWIQLREPWTIIIFQNYVENMTQPLIDLLARSIVIVGFFSDAPLHPELETKLLRKEIMIIKNLARHESLTNHSGQFTGYMLLFEILSRYTKEFPLLGNLILVEHEPDSLRCSRTKGHRLEVLNHDFVGYIPMSPGYQPPEVLGDEIIKFPEHYGTHIEAPYHMTERGFTAETVPPDRSFVPCIRVHQYEMTHNAYVGLHVFQDWERKAGTRIPEGSFVFVDTYNNRNWPNYDEYVGRNKETNETRFMGVDPEAARWLINNRRIYGMGIDTLSTDGTSGARKMETHVALAQGNAIGIENVAYVDRLPNVDKEPRMKPVSSCLMVHLRIEGGTGAPVAIFVHTEGYNETYTMAATTSSGLVVQLTASFFQILVLSKFLEIMSTF